MRHYCCEFRRSSHGYILGRNPFFQPLGECALNYKRDLTEKIGLNSRIGYRYRSEYTTGQDNDPITLQDGFVTIDGTLGFEFNDGQIGLDFWGKNLTDQTITNIVFDTPLQPGSFSAFLEAPRTYGATLRLTY